MGLGTFLKHLFATPSPQQRESSIAELHSQLPYTFSNEEYLQAALTHPSYSGDQGYHFLSYERLEYLGDAVLEMVMSDQLFRKYPKASEGELTRHRAALVNKVTLATRARELNLPHYIRAQSVPENPIEESESVLSDVMEALIGAAYLDGGMQAARTVIAHLLPLEDRATSTAPDRRNYKGELIEYCHTHDIPSPAFRTLAKSGPDHSRTYRVAVTIRNTLLGEGQGPSKKKAGQIAAKHALTRLQHSAELRETL